MESNKPEDIVAFKYGGIFGVIFLIFILILGYIFSLFMEDNIASIIKTNIILNFVGFIIFGVLLVTALRMAKKTGIHFKKYDLAFVFFGVYIIFSSIFLSVIDRGFTFSRVGLLSLILMIVIPALMKDI